MSVGSFLRLVTLSLRPHNYLEGLEGDRAGSAISMTNGIPNVCFPLN